MAFVLSEKGELYADVETTVNTTPAASTLDEADVQNLKTFKTRRVPGKIQVEDEGGGMIPGVAGQELLKVNEMVEYEGSMYLREFAVPGSDTGARPDYDIWLRAGGFLEGVYNLGDQTVTYDMSLANNGESVVYRYREWDSEGGRKLHDVQGGRHSLNFKFVAGEGILIEITNGKAFSYATSQVSAASTTPSLTLNGGTSVVPYLGATQSLLEIGGSTYSGKIREVNFGLPQRTEMLPDAASATGFCEAFSNIIKPTFDMLLYEKDDGLQIRDAWATADAHFYLSLSVAGPAAAGNTMSFQLYFDIESIAEESGPGGTKALRVTGRLLFADRTNNALPALDPSEPPIRMVLTTT